MRFRATSRSTTKMAAASTEPIPDASSVSALHDGGPDWEGREKASFDSRRGSNVWYRRWSPQSKAVAMLMIAHGLHSHGGRWAKVAHHYTEKGYLVYANDHIGHGLTAQGPNGGAIGIVDDHTKMTDDFTEFVEKMVDKEEDKTLPVFILGHSMGSLVATVAAENCIQHPTIGPRFKKLVLSGCPIVPGPSSASPFGFRFLYPLTKNAAMLRRLSGMLARMDPKGPAAPIDQAALSKDPSVALTAAADPLMVKGKVRNKTAFEVVKLIQAAKESASKVTVPTLLVHGAEDDIAYPKGSEDMKKLLTSCTSVDCQVYDGVMHEVLNHQEHFQTVVAAIDKHWEAS